jgi:hypothetical protein
LKGKTETKTKSAKKKKKLLGRAPLAARAARGLYGVSGRAA